MRPTSARYRWISAFSCPADRGSRTRLGKPSVGNATVIGVGGGSIPDEFVGSIHKGCGLPWQGHQSGGRTPMPGIGRRSLLKTASVAAGGLALGGTMTASAVAAAPRSERAAGGTVNVRWIGGGVV